MKKIVYLLSTVAVLALPMLAAAQGFADGGDGGALTQFIVSLQTFINNILVPLVMALAFLAFVWGMFVFFIAGGADEEKREKGKNLMIYAVLGFVLIIILWGLINFLASSIGLEGETIAVPQIPTTRGT